MSLNEKNKHTYGTVPVVDSGATKGSRRGVVVGFAAAACFALGFLAASVGPSATQGLRGTALYVKDTSTVWNNEGKKDNVDVGDVPAGGCVGGGCGDGTAPVVKPAPAVKPVAGVAGVPGLGNNVSPPAPPAKPVTPTPATPAASNCCQVFGSCPAGYKPSGNVNANSACCKDWSLGISINSGMPTCPTTPANDPFPNPNWTMGDPIGPITPQTENLGPIVQTGDKPITIGGPKIGAIKTPDTQTNLGPIQTGNPNGMFNGESVFGPGGFNGGKPLMPNMGPGSDFANSFGQGFPFTGGESTGVGAGPAVNTGAGMPGAGGEDVGFGVPHSHKTTPGGGVATHGY